MAELLKFDDFKRSILSLEFEANTPFQSLDLLECWLDHVPKEIGRTFRVVQIEKEGKSLFFPTIIQKIRGQKTLTWAMEDFCDYQLPWLEKGAPLNVSVLEELSSREADIVVLKNLPEEVLGGPSNIRHLLPESRVFSKSKGIHLPSSFEAYIEQGIKKKIWKDTKRQRRRLEEIGKLSFEHEISDLSLLEFTFTQKSRRYRETNQLDQFQESWNRAFYAELVRSKFLQFSIFWLDRVPLATHLGTCDERTFYYLLPTYEGGEWHKYSPGRLLLLELIERSINSDKSYFDFTGGSESYKDEWCNHSFELGLWERPTSLKGRLYLAGKRWVKEFRQSSPDA